MDYLKDKTKNDLIDTVLAAQIAGGRSTILPPWEWPTCNPDCGACGCGPDICTPNGGFCNG